MIAERGAAAKPRKVHEAEASLLFDGHTPRPGKPDLKTTRLACAVDYVDG